MMSSGYKESSIVNFEKSPGASLSSLNEATTQDVDELLYALEETTNEPDFLNAGDDEFVLNLLRAEKADEALGASLPSLGGLEPLALDEIPSDPNLLASLGMDLEFQQNSLKLDDFIMKSNVSDSEHVDRGSVNQKESLELERAPAAAQLYPEMMFEPSTISIATGKRRRVPRRGSLPSMHLNYEDPYEPTPIPEPSAIPLAQASYEPPTKLAAVPVEDSTGGDPPPGGRRRAQRRGSLPSMHLHYDVGAQTQTVDVLVNESGDAVAPREDDQVPRRAGRMQRRGSTGSSFGGGVAMAFGSPNFFSFENSCLIQHHDDGMDAKEEENEAQYSQRNQGRMPRRGSTGSQFGDFTAYGGSSIFSSEESSGPMQNISESDSNDERLPKLGRMQRRGSTGSNFGGSMSFGDSSHLGVGDVSTTVPENLDPKIMMKRLQDMMKRSLETQKVLQKWDKDNGLPKSHSQTMVNTSRSRKQLQDGVILPKWDGTPLISKETELGKPKPRAKPQKEEGGKMKRRMSAPASSALY